MPNRRKKTPTSGRPSCESYNATNVANRTSTATLLNKRHEKCFTWNPRRNGNQSSSGEQRPPTSMNTIGDPITTARLGRPGNDNRITMTWKLQLLAPTNHRHRCYSRLETRQSFHHTRLYSLRFSWSIVSLTAAKTKRIFSVSAEKQHSTNITEHQKASLDGSVECWTPPPW